MVKLVRTLLGFSLSCLLWLIYRHRIHQQSVAKTAMLAVVSSALFGVLWTVFETGFFWFTLADFDLLNSLQYKPRAALTYTVTLLAWSAIYFGIEYWKQIQVAHQKMLQAKILAESAQLAMLRYQVNPHFLFNALNSIRASINPSNANAKQMITQLSEFLRHSLMSNADNENTLGEELEAAENYLAIEKIRFEEALNIEWCIDERTKPILLPSFLLNPLVENAIKHGFKTSTDVLKIKIHTRFENEKLIIEVKNTGCLYPDQINEVGQVGLKNVQQRLEMQRPNKSHFSLTEKQGWVLARIELETHDL